MVFDLRFFSFLWFDDFTTSHQFFVTRMRHKIAYRTVQELRIGPSYRDEMIELGQYRSHPCQHPVRMVSVLWGGVWYRYRTNVLDPQVLSARHVCELYRRRWRIEDAFALTKRVLDLAYLWTGSANAVQLQIYATLIFYAVLLTICQQGAQVLGEPLERISIAGYWLLTVRRGKHITSALWWRPASADTHQSWKRSHVRCATTPRLSDMCIREGTVTITGVIPTAGEEQYP